MKYSIIIRCYNTLPLIKKCVEAVIQSTDDDTEIILINNHPPHKTAIDYLQNLHHPRVVVLDPGRNIGNFGGVNYGAKHAKGKYLIILDDDIIVPNNNWIEVMSQALIDFPNLAYTSLLCSHIKTFLLSYTDPQAQEIQKSEYTIQFTNNIVIFGCVMLEKTLWQQYFSNIKLSHLELFEIEGDYKIKANQIGMKTGYILSHMAEHLGATNESDLVYYAWKVFYIFGLATTEYVEWRKNKTAFTKEEELTLRNKGYSDLFIEEIKNAFINSPFQS